MLRTGCRWPIAKEMGGPYTGRLQVTLCEPQTDGCARASSHLLTWSLSTSHLIIFKWEILGNQRHISMMIAKEIARISNNTNTKIRMMEMRRWWINYASIKCQQILNVKLKFRMKLHLPEDRTHQRPKHSHIRRTIVTVIASVRVVPSPFIYFVKAMRASWNRELWFVFSGVPETMTITSLFTFYIISTTIFTECVD